ncbi:unnamed protein product [Rhodiola kirilowii]
MSEVLSMLTNDVVAIPSPKTPAFSSSWISPSSKPNTAVNNHSNNGLSLSVVDGR